MAIKKTEDNPNNIWVISEGRHIDFNLKKLNSNNICGPVTEYYISDIGRYLIKPAKIQIKDILIGCYVKYKSKGIKFFFKKAFKIFNKKLGEKYSPEWVKFLTQSNIKKFSLKDKILEAHIKKIYDAIIPYDPLFRKLNSINKEDLYDISGICEDISGTRYKLELQGSVSDKLDYVIRNLFREVMINIERPYLTNGLFELRGFDFQSCIMNRKHRLIKYYNDNKVNFSVLNLNGTEEFRVDDSKLIQYLHILEQSIKTNSILSDSIKQCINGDASPFKLFFTHKIELSYSETKLPKIFNKEKDIIKLNDNLKNNLAQILNSQQKVVSFNYVPRNHNGSDKMHTSISILHNVKALESIKDEFPELYNKLDNDTPVSDAGKYYLLDTLQGHDE